LFNHLIALYAATDITQHLEQILTALRPLIESKSATTDALAENVSDNACGAVGRIILASPQLVPLSHVLPVLMTGLPLVKDNLEYTPVIKALIMVVRENLAEVNLSWFMGLIADTAADYDAGTQTQVVEFLKMIAGGSSWAGLMESVGQEKAAKLGAMVQG
jgi:hypothetical protein